MAIDRNYQVTAIENSRNAIRRGIKRILIQASTGAGKTHIASRIIESAIAKGNRVLFVAHRKEIISQSAKKLESMGIHHGIIMAGVKPTASNVQVASVQTLNNREKPDANIIFFDEAHLSVSASFMSLVEHYSDAIIIGLTATPTRLDGRGLGEIYHEMVQVVPMRELIDAGFLVKPRVFAPFTPDMKSIAIKRGDYDNVAVAETMDKSAVTGDIVKYWQSHAQGRKTIAFASSVEHSKHIVEAFNNAGIAAKHLDGTTPSAERDAVLSEWARGEFDVLSNMGLFVEGLDVPAVSCVILARPTKSLSVYMQAVGRGMRPAEGKNDLIILDHSGCTYEHGTVDMPRDWSLEAKKKKKRDGEKAPAVKVCKQCFAAFTGTTVCPECGHEHERETVTTTSGEGELIELHSDYIEFVVKQKRKEELKQARTDEQLIELGRARGYKNPIYWAQMIQKKRQEWRAQRG